MEYIVIGILFLVIVYQGVMQYLWYQEKQKEAQDLLDRIMSTDYSQFSSIRVNTGERMAEVGKKMEVISTDDLEEKLRAGAVII